MPRSGPGSAGIGLPSSRISPRWCVSSSRRLTAEIRSRFERAAGCQVRQQYGMTETGPLRNDSDQPPCQELDCMGRPLPGVDGNEIGNRFDVAEPEFFETRGKLLQAREVVLYALLEVRFIPERRDGGGLRGAMDQGTTGFLKSGTFKKQVFEEDRDRIVIQLPRVDDA